MNLNLPFTAETEAWLRASAAAANQRIEEFVLDAVADKLAEVATPTNQQGHLRGDAWQQEFQTLLSQALNIAHFVDDSRESVYGDRGQ